MFQKPDGFTRIHKYSQVLSLLYLFRVCFIRYHRVMLSRRLRASAGLGSSAFMDASSPVVPRLWEMDGHVMGMVSACFC